MLVGTVMNVVLLFVLKLDMKLKRSWATAVEQSQAHF